MPTQNNAGFRAAEALISDFVKLGGMKRTTRELQAEGNSKLFEYQG